MSAGTAAGAVGEALSAAADALGAAGVDTPRLDAELLLAEATGLDRARLIAEPKAPVDATAARVFGAAVRRRLRREPLAYITGRKGFRRIELAVDPRVLIPRPETELLVEVALELDPAAVLDVGTGSGAVALAIADELPGAAVVATDSSGRALEVAKRNAERLGLEGRVRFAEGTLPRAELPGTPRSGDPPDLLAANLPYVSDAEWHQLAPEIRDHEPREALVAGPTGLEEIRALLEQVGRGERPAAIALEVGEGQADDVAELARAAGFGAVEARRDLAGIDRVVLGR